MDRLEPSCWFSCLIAAQQQMEPLFNSRLLLIVGLYDVFVLNNILRHQSNIFVNTKQVAFRLLRHAEPTYCSILDAKEMGSTHLKKEKRKVAILVLDSRSRSKTVIFTSTSKSSTYCFWLPVNVLFRYRLYVICNLNWHSLLCHFEAHSSHGLSLHLDMDLLRFVKLPLRTTACSIKFTFNLIA